MLHLCLVDSLNMAENAAPTVTPASVEEAEMLGLDMDEMEATLRLQAATRGRNARRNSVLKREPKAEVVARWKTLVNSVLVRDAGVDWGAIKTTLSVVGYVPPSEEAIEAMERAAAEKQM